MKIFLTGATGFIGGHTLRALVEHGHEVTCLVRDSARGRITSLPRVRVVEGQWTLPETWVNHVAGHEAVINTVGIIREARGATFEAVHTNAPVALFNAAARAGVSKIVQLSALGADSSAVSRYHLSKRTADAYLTHLGVPYVVLRPSFVYGTGDHSMTFFTRLATLPVTPVPGDGEYCLQPLSVSDLVRAILMASTSDDFKAVTVNVGGGQVLTFNALLDTLALLHGKQRGALKLHIPWPLMRLVAAVTDALGGRGPITSEELGMLRRGSHTDNELFIAQFGFAPVPFEVGIAHKQPSS